MKNTLIRTINQLLGFFPSALPQGASEFDSWADSISTTYRLPTQDRDSLHFTLASILMHSGPTTAYKSKWFFAISIKAAAAKQVAGQAFHDIKTKHSQPKPALTVVPDATTV